MADAPWASDPVVGDYEHGGFNQSVGNVTEPVAAPANQAAPWAADPAANDAAPATPPLVDGSQPVGSFGDDPKPREAATRMAPGDEQQLLHILQTGSADDARRFAASKGFAGPDNFDAVIAARDKGGGVDKNLLYHLPTSNGKQMEAPGSFGRGIGDAVSMSFLPRLGAVADALGGTHGRENVFNSDKSFGELYDHNLDINNGILDADEANHPYARLTGQLIGNMAIPIGMEGVGLEAGKSVLRLGGTMREARAAAAAAVRNRMAAVGAGMGAAHGAGESEGGPGQMVAGALMGAAEGGAGGYGLTRVGQAIGEHAPALVDAIKAGTRKIGNAVEDMIGHGEPVPPTEGQPDYVQIARDLHIARTPATNSRTGIATVVQSGLGALPGGTPVGAASAGEAADLGAAARAVAEGVGPVSTRAGAGESVAHGAQQFADSSKTQAKTAYTRRNALMGGDDAPVQTDQAKAQLDSIASQFPTSSAIADLREHPAIRKIEGALPGEPTTEDVATGVLDAEGKPITRPVTTTPQPLTVREATEALSYIRGVSRRLAASGADNAMLARVDSLKNALNGDVKAAATQADLAAGRDPAEAGGALQSHLEGDRIYSDRSTALNATKGSLGRAYSSAQNPVAVSGESVYNGIAANMDRKTGNLTRLRDQWFRLPPEARATFAATKIDEMGRAESGQQNDLSDAWSFNTFLKHRDTLSPQARNIVFGAGADKQLDQIAAYASRLKQLDRARNFSNTAKTYFAGAFMATVGHAIWQGDIAHAAEMATALPATWGGAKLLLTTPKMRDWTVQAMKAMQGPNSETALKVLTRRLGTIAASEPSIADQALGLQRHIMQAVNDNAPRVAAASPQGKKQKPQGR